MKTTQVLSPDNITGHPTWFIKSEIITFIKDKGVDTSVVYLKNSGSLHHIYFKELCKDTFICLEVA